MLLALKHHCFAGNYLSYHGLLRDLSPYLLKEQEQVTQEQFEKMVLRLGTLMTFKPANATPDDLKVRVFSINSLIKDLETANRKDLSAKVKINANAMKVFD